MPLRPRADPILSRDHRFVAERLWRRLGAARWPVPPHALPAGTALVGGAVRDGLLDRLGLRPDLDFVVKEDAVVLVGQLRDRFGGSAVVLDRQRSIARLVVEGWTIDLARCDGADLGADLSRRDYTINAIALPLSPGGSLLDPHGGLADLAERRLVAIRETNLLDDPLRLLRGLRLAAELNFAIDPTTWEWIRKHHATLRAVAPERIQAELLRLTETGSGHLGLMQVLEADLLEGFGTNPEADRLLPALGPEEARRRGLTDMEAARALPLARIEALLDATGLRQLATSRRLQQRCRQIREWRTRLLAGDASLPLEALEEGERLSLQRSLETDLPALLLHLPVEESRQALCRWRDPSDPLHHPRPPLDGSALQRALSIPPGEHLGLLIDHLTLERAFGRLPREGSDPELILAVARHWLSHEGLRHDLLQ